MCFDVACAADLLGEQMDMFLVRDNADRADRADRADSASKCCRRQSWQAPKPKEAAKANSDPAGCQFLGILKHNSQENLREAGLVDPRWSQLKSSLC